jgi:hypothetical protein
MHDDNLFIALLVSLKNGLIVGNRRPWVYIRMDFIWVCWNNRMVRSNNQILFRADGRCSFLIKQSA